MVKKINSYVCNSCNTCIGQSQLKSEGWLEEGKHTHYCPKCQRGESVEDEVDLYPSSLNSVFGIGSGDGSKKTPI